MLLLLTQRNTLNQRSCSFPKPLNKFDSVRSQRENGNIEFPRVERKRFNWSITVKDVFNQSLTVKSQRTSCFDPALILTSTLQTRSLTKLIESLKERGRKRHTWWTGGKSEAEGRETKRGAESGARGTRKRRESSTWKEQMALPSPSGCVQSESARLEVGPCGLQAPEATRSNTPTHSQRHGVRPVALFSSALQL